MGQASIRTSAGHDAVKRSAARQAIAGERLGPSAVAPECSPEMVRLALTDGKMAMPATMLALQRVVGNRVARAIIRPQPSAGPDEEAAEQAAGQNPGPFVTTSVPTGQQDLRRRAGEEQGMQTSSSTLQRAGDGFEADALLESRLAALRSGGSPMPLETRASMEPRFGADFGGVRIHTDSESADMNRELKAQAFAHGRDIYMGADRYDPGSSGGRQLLAHELTHVVQQTGSIQRTLIDESERSFATAGGRSLKDPQDNTVGPTYPEIKQYTDDLMPTSEQSSLIKLRATLVSWMSKSPDVEKRLKDVIRAFLLGLYAKRLSKLQTDDRYPTAKDKKKRQAFYLEKAIESRDKYASLLQKGVAAPETRAFLDYAGFSGLFPLSETEKQTEIAKGPRIDVRSTFLGGPIYGMKVRAHLFIVYTGSGGTQWYFRGGPGGPGGATRADYGEYVPGTIDWDPSAPSVTVLQGGTAKEKLDGMIEASRAVNGMGVPYEAGGVFKEGENCNATAWTILTRAGVPTNKPSGKHPGWGHILGTVSHKGGPLPQPEDVTGPGIPMVIVGAPTTSVQVFLDRLMVERGPQLPGGTPVEVLAELGELAKIRYQGTKIGFMRKDQLETPPVAPVAGRAFKLRGETEVYKPSAMEVQHTLSGETLVTVISPDFVVGTADGNFVSIQYLYDGRRQQGRVKDWDLESID